MGLRFRRSVKIAPGLKLNINKNSIGLSAGVKGARVSVNTKGDVTKSVGLPGTGLSYVERKKIGKNKKKSLNSSDDDFRNYSNSNFEEPISPKPKPPFYQRRWFMILSLIFFAPVGIFLLFKYSKQNKFLKAVYSVLSLFMFFALYLPSSEAAIPPPESGIVAQVSDDKEEEPIKENEISSLETNHEKSGEIGNTDSANTEDVENLPKEAEDLQTSAVEQSPAIEEPATPDQSSTVTVAAPIAAQAVESKPEQKSVSYVGSTESNKYHYTSCRWAKKILPENLITFDSIQDAKDHGYDACGTCKPR